MIVPDSLGFEYEKTEHLRVNDNGGHLILSYHFGLFAALAFTTILRFLQPFTMCCAVRSMQGA